MASVRRSTRANKGVKAKDPDLAPDRPPRRLPTFTRPKKARKGTLKYYEEQAAPLPELGEPGLVIPTPSYTKFEFFAMLGLMPKRKMDEEPKSPDRPYNENGEAQDSGDAARDTELPPEKKTKLDC